MDRVTKRRWIYHFMVLSLLVLFIFVDIFKNTRLFLVLMILSLVSVFAFYIGDHWFDLKFTFSHYMILFIIVFFGLVILPVENQFLYYDKILHFIFPILISFLIYYVVDKNLNITPKQKILVTFAALICFLTVFEFIEYTGDVILDMKAQGVYAYDPATLQKILVLDRNDDTMLDLILGAMGGMVFFLIKSVEPRKKAKIKK